MRLDHLLSKELLALFLLSGGGVSRRQVITECVVLVCSWVEHMTRLPVGGFGASTSSSGGWNVSGLLGGGLHAVGS